MVMICAQLMAFGRVHRLREEGKEQRRLKKENAEIWKTGSSVEKVERANGYATGKPTATKTAKANGTIKARSALSPSTDVGTPNGRYNESQRYSPDTGEESEVIL